MSKENETETEKIISDKLNSREFAFDEKAWAGMETLLDAEQKKRRVGFWWWFSASMFLVLVAGAAYYNSLNVEKPESSNVVTSSEVEKQNMSKSAIMEQKQEKLAEINSANKKITSAIETQSSANEATSIAIKTISSTIETKSFANKAQSSANKTITSTIQTQSSANETMSSAIETQSSANEIMSSANEAKISAIKTENPANELTSPAIKTQSSATEVISPAIEEESLANKNDSATTAEQTAAIETKTPLTAPGKETKNAWGVMAGVGYWFPYQSTLDATDTKGVIGFTGGIYYQRAFSKHVELGASAVYSSRGALNYDKTIIDSEFGFGVENDKTTISPQTLHYLTIPLYLRFSLTPRSHLLVGASYYQLLATASKITHTTENSFGVLESTTEKQTGEHAGFRKNDIAAFIGYELTLFDRMNAGLQFSYGFYDITDNSYNNIEGTDRNISLQLQLKYDLIRH